MYWGDGLLSFLLFTVSTVHGTTVCIFELQKYTAVLTLEVCTALYSTNVLTAVVGVVVLTLTRIMKSVVTGQAQVTLELRNTPGKNTNNLTWHTSISQLTQFMPPL